jgi:hypothetical protein
MSGAVFSHVSSTSRAARAADHEIAEWRWQADDEKVPTCQWYEDVMQIDQQSPDICPNLVVQGVIVRLWISSALQRPYHILKWFHRKQMPPRQSCTRLSCRISLEDTPGKIT